MALPSIYKSIVAPKGANPQDVQSVQDQMAITYAPQESSINTAIDQINQYLTRDVNAQQQYGQIADQRIAGIGSALKDQLQGNVGSIGNIFQAGGQQVGNIYDQATADTRAAGQSIQAPIQQGMQNLGIKADPYGRDPLSRLMGQQSLTEGRLAASKAGTQANLATLGTALQGIAQKAVGDSEREYAQKRTDVATQVLQVIGQLQTTANTGIMEQLRKFSDLAETEGPAFRTLLTQATSSRNKAEADAAQQAFDNYIKSSDLAIKQQKAITQDDPNSLDNLLKQATLQKYGIDIQKGQNELNRPDYISDVQGNQNLLDYLNGVVRKDRSSPGISGTQHAGIQNFINQNLGLASTSGLYNTTDPIKILNSIAQDRIDPSTGMVKLPITPGSKYNQQDYEVDPQTLLEAITARFAGVGSSTKIGTPIK